MIPLRHDEIRWTSNPLDHPENVDLLGLDEREILAYARDFQEECRTLRYCLRESFHALARQHDQLTRTTRVIDHQRRELRAQRVAA